MVWVTFFKAVRVCVPAATMPWYHTGLLSRRCCTGRNNFFSFLVVVVDSLNWALSADPVTCILSPIGLQLVPSTNSTYMTNNAFALCFCFKVSGRRRRRSKKLICCYSDLLFGVKRTQFFIHLVIFLFFRLMVVVIVVMLVIPVWHFSYNNNNKFFKKKNLSPPPSENQKKKKGKGYWGIFSNHSFFSFFVDFCISFSPSPRRVGGARAIFAFLFFCHGRGGNFFFFLKSEKFPSCSSLRRRRHRRRHCCSVETGPWENEERKKEAFVVRCNVKKKYNVGASFKTDEKWRSWTYHPTGAMVMVAFRFFFLSAVVWNREMQGVAEMERMDRSILQGIYVRTGMSIPVPRTCSSVPTIATWYNVPVWLTRMRTELTPVSHGISSTQIYSNVWYR